MTELAARAVPVGAERIGLDEPTRVRLVLTGAGGGTWDVSLGGRRRPRGRADHRRYHRLLPAGGQSGDPAISTCI